MAFSALNERLILLKKFGFQITDQMCHEVLIYKEIVSFLIWDSGLEYEHSFVFVISWIVLYCLKLNA